MALSIVLVVASAGWLMEPGAGTSAAPPPSAPETHAEALAAAWGMTLGAALACSILDRERFEALASKVQASVEAAVDDDDELTSAQALFQRGMAHGNRAVTEGELDCDTTGARLADLEASLSD
jgi:hypothetical protein